MNIKDGDAGRESIAAAPIPSAKGGSSKRRAKRGSRAKGIGAGQPVGDSLTRDAGRLLATLGQSETSAIVDPTDPASVLIHRRRSGISVFLDTANETVPFPLPCPPAVTVSHGTLVEADHAHDGAALTTTVPAPASFENDVGFAETA